MYEYGPDPDAFRDLSTTDLALRATKDTAQAISRAIANLVVLKRHLWLNLTEIKDADRTALNISFLTLPNNINGITFSTITFQLINN